jgi:hypothetical protein
VTKPPWGLSVGLAAVALTGCGGKASTPNGPLAGSVRYSSASGAAVPINKPYSFGISLTNASAQAMVLDRVTPLGKHGSLIIEGVGIAHHPKNLIGSAVGFPPPDLGTSLHRVGGWSVAPHENDDDLILGIRMPRAGVASIQRIRIDYHSGKHRYRVDLPYTIEECAPVARWPHSCPTPHLPN